MEIKELQDKLVAVLGYGLEGKAVAAFLLRHGIKPVLFDQKPWQDWPLKEQEEIKKLGVNFIFGPDAFKELAGFDIAFRSPGIKFSKLAAYNLQLTSQTKWFFEHCPAKIIGVTGTKGKGTTSALIYEMLRQQSADSNQQTAMYLTGNIGKVQPLEILNRLTPNDWIIYELSSFQLQDLTQSPHIGVVLMVTTEHMDYHKNQDEYLQAKSAITKFQKAGDAAIINLDFEASKRIGEQGGALKLYFSTQNEADCYTADGIINFNSKTSGQWEKITRWQLRGRHNWQNLCAAVLAADFAGCKPISIIQAVKNFRGLEHRLEFVAEKNGIKFYNDSFSTVPETAIAAINSFDEPLIVILGGSSKNSDFTELGETIARAKNIKTAILVGQEADRINAAIKSSGAMVDVKLTAAKNMSEIFDQIRPIVKTGDVVLLSPACASFGMFKNYNDRGDQFKKLTGDFSPQKYK